MLLATQPDEDDRTLHRALLTTSLASGEGLLLECADAESLKPLRLTPGAVAAKLESLRITFTQWHTESRPDRQAAILEEAFGDCSRSWLEGAGIGAYLQAAGRRKTKPSAFTT
jgi:hypothetical protein